MTTTLTGTAAAVAARAVEFAATLSASQRAALCQPYRPDTVRHWSNYPQAVLGRHGRVGLATGTLTPRQWAALEALLAAATGTGPDAGLARIRQLLAADDHLLACGGRHGYGRGHFVVALLGTPGPHGRWQLQFGGHHLALARTYVDGVLAGATPSFRGIEPFGPFEQDGVSYDPERRLRQAFTALLGSLDAEQAAHSTLPGRQRDLLLGPGVDWAFPDGPARGLPGTDLDGDQRRLLLAAIAVFVDDVDDDAAAGILARYEAELEQTRLGRVGTTSLDRVGDYVRIDGPSVWIELSMHDGIVLPGPHPHAVWRDRRTDYGGTRF